MFSRDKSKKGVSIIIGYVLLVTFAVIIGLIVFQWMKSYVPKEDLNCPDGVSIFIQNYDCSLDILNLNLKNNGKFDIGGYFIYATDSPNEELATIDLSKNNTDIYSRLKPLGIKFGSIIPGNSLNPGDEETEKYNITGISNLYSIEILPIRWQKEKNRNVLVSCKDAKISEIIICNAPEGECVAESTEYTCTRVNAVCGIEINNCLEEVNCGICPTAGDECNSVGQCVPAAQCTDTCASLGWVCNAVCGISCGNCPTLPHSLPACNNGVCIISSCASGWDNCDGIESNGCEANLLSNEFCGSCTNSCVTGTNCAGGICTSCNGTWTYTSETPDVECDGTPKPANCFANCSCMGEYSTSGTGGCKIPTSVVDSCPSYCNLFIGYTNGGCYINPQNCAGLPGGIYAGNIPGADGAYADSFCVSNADTCCCIP